MQSSKVLGLLVVFTQACDRNPVPAAPNVEVQAAVTSNSERYREFEEAGSARQRFMDLHNQKFSQHLQARAGTAQFGKWLYEKMNVQRARREKPLPDGTKLRLVEQGTGRATEIFLVKTDASGQETAEKLFSNFDLKGMAANVILEMETSPDGRYFFLVISQQGSTDEMLALTYDLSNRRVGTTRFKTFSGGITWISPTEVLVDQARADGRSTLVRFDVVSERMTDMGRGAILSRLQEHLLVYVEGRYEIINVAKGTHVYLAHDGVGELVHVDDSGAYAVARNEDAPLGEIVRFPTVAGPEDYGVFGQQVLAPARALQSASFRDGSFFVETSAGVDRWITAYALAGARQAEAKVPDCCTVLNVDWETRGQRLSFALMSPVKGEGHYVYDVAAEQWNEDPNEPMLLADGIQFRTDVVFAKSADGTLVPSRMTRRSDLVKNGEAPVLMTSYGGFNVAGYLQPRYASISYEFLKRGGITVGTGLRGGNEFGDAWHTAAMREFKFKTYEDLVASARLYVSDGWTRPAKIISTGTSNGGLTVAATALLYPKDFGLVIPVAGVLDLLGKETLDANFGGWADEYGDAREAAERAYLEKISPLELVSNFGDTRFLVVIGDSDTRVNVAHSLKFTAALEAAGAKPDHVDLLSVRAAGHWVQSAGYSNVRAWKVNHGIWSKIFEQAGWTW